MLRYFLVLFPVLLSGCGLPPAVMIASYAADGVSYVATGKSVSDHGISAVTGRDCAVWRIVKGERRVRGDDDHARAIGRIARVRRWRDRTQIRRRQRAPYGYAGNRQTTSEIGLH